MKKIFRLLMIAAGMVAMLSSCTKEQVVGTPVLKIDPVNQIALSEETSGQVAVTASWEVVSTTASYTLYLAPTNGKKGVHYTISAGSATSVAITGEELQKALYYCGFEQGASTTVNFFVEAQDGNVFSQSETVSIRVILYTHVVVLNTPVLTVSPSDVVLDLNTPNNKAIDVNWTDASSEGAVIEYTLGVGIQGSEDTSMSFPIGEELTFNMTNSEFQTKLMDAGYQYGEEAALFAIVYAEATDGTIAPVESEPVNFKVTLSKKPRNPNIPGSLHIVGSATGANWDIKDDYKFTCLDEEKGIFYLKTEITNLLEFKFLADDSWKKGFTHNSDISKYWDIVYKNGDLGDNDYFRILVPGIYEFTVNSEELTIDVKLVEAKLEKIYVLGSGVPGAGWNFKDECTLKLVDPANGIYEETLELAPADIQILPMNGNWNFGFFVPEKVTLSETPAKVYEQREQNQYPSFFTVAEAGTYKITLDTKNLTIKAVLVE